MFELNKAKFTSENNHVFWGSYAACIPVPHPQGVNSFVGKTRE